MAYWPICIELSCVLDLSDGNAQFGTIRGSLFRIAISTAQYIDLLCYLSRDGVLRVKNVIEWSRRNPRTSLALHLAKVQKLRFVDTRSTQFVIDGEDERSPVSYLMFSIAVGL